MAIVKIVSIFVLLCVICLSSARPQEAQQIVKPRPIVEKNVESDLEAGDDAKDLSGAESAGYGYYAGLYPYSYGGYGGYGGYYPYYSGYSSYITHGYPYYSGYRGFGGLYGGYYY